MILYDKILWADDMLFIMSRWYMMPYYDYGWWCIVYPGICGRLCIHTLWHEESDLRTSFDLPTSGSASQSLFHWGGQRIKTPQSWAVSYVWIWDFGGISGPGVTNSEHPATCPRLWVCKSCISEMFVEGVILRMKLLWANGWSEVYKEKAGCAHNLETKL